MTQRFSGVSDQEASGLAKEILDGSTLFLGRSSNLLRILTKHSPYLARWFLGFVAAVRQPNLGASSDVRLRNLATIKTSMTNACSYCSAHTSTYGQALGLKDSDIEALKSDDYKTSDAYTEKEKIVIAWAEAMTKNEAKRDKGLWEKMRQHFTDAEIVEISLASAMFDMINRLNDTFWTELESLEYNRRQRNAVKGVRVEQLEDFASRFRVTGDAERTRTQPAAAE
jgi:alkylhydroperoxidase family enzyme